MSDKINNPGGTYGRILRIASVIVTAAIIVTAIVLAAACIHLYKTGGDQPYTRERAGAYLTAILPCTLTCLVLVIAMGVLDLLFGERAKTKNRISASAMLSILRKKHNGTPLSAEYEAAVAKERKTRMIGIINCAAVGTVLFGAVIVYSLINTESYTVEACTDQAAILAILASAAFVLEGGLVFLTMLAHDKSYARELEATKIEFAAAKERGVLVAAEGDTKHLAEGHTVYIIRGAIFIAAIVFIILGISNGSMNDVLGKAVQICTECIGLG